VHKLLLPLSLLVTLWPPQAAPPRPPVLGLAHVALRTSDLAKARQFYGTLLGFAETASPAPDVAVFRVNDRQRIIVTAGLAADRADRFDNVAWETDDLAAMRRYLAAKAVATHDVEVRGEGTALETTDADAHQIQLLQRSAPAAATADADRRVSMRILHTGLTIRDAAAADQFYKDALGFSEIWRGGRPEGTINWINMRAPEGTDYLEYMLAPAPLDRRQLGNAHHIALLVTDIQAALDAVRARTSPGELNHRAVPQIGVNRRWQLNVYDPDGTRIEFMEPWPMR